MRKSGITFVSLLLTGVSVSALSAGSEFKVDSRILTIPTVKIGSTYVYDARLKLNNAGSFDIIGFSESPSSEANVNAECTEDQITLDKYNQISSGMTLEQVNNIIGCKERLFTAASVASIFNWSDGSYPQIQVSIRNSVVFSKTYTPSQ